jgi:WD40 repeat protein
VAGLHHLTPACQHLGTYWRHAAVKWADWRNTALVLTAGHLCYAGRVCYWDLVEGTMVGGFQAHGGPVCSLSVHPELPMLVTCSTDGSIKTWV